jgi:hypothetical protein
MTGIFLIIVVVGWLIAVVIVARWVARRSNSPTTRVVSWIVFFPALLAAPLADELIGGRQFEQLCKDNATIQVDRATAVGKTVYFVPQPAIEVKGTWVRVVLKPQRFVDARTGETVVTYNELIAGGGRLIRTLGISEGGVPLIFKGTCAPENRPSSIQTFAAFGIKYIEPPTAKNGDTK